MTQINQDSIDSILILACHSTNNIDSNAQTCYNEVFLNFRRFIRRRWLINQNLHLFCQDKHYYLSKDEGMI